MTKVEDKIRIMIVDDEEHARNELIYLLGKYSDVCVVGQANNFHETLEGVCIYQPHLVFMDIEMPGMNGIKVAEKLLETNIAPLLVFATAHDEFALKAFELNAVDYLLKPFSSQRVDHCIAKVRNLLRSMESVDLKKFGVALGNIPNTYTKNKLAIEYNGKVTVIDVSQIIAVCCSEGQLKIYTTQQCYQSHMTLQELQSRLDEQSFFRSHRAYLVNIEKIHEIVPWFNGTLNLILEGLPNMEIPVSRTQVSKLKKLFDL